MRVGFLQNAMGEIVSALVPKASMPTVLMKGDQMMLCSDLILSEIGVIIAAGTLATVIMHCVATGAVELDFNRVIPGLHIYGNTLLLVPYTTEDAVEALNTALKLKPNCVVSIVDEPNTTAPPKTKVAASCC